MMKLYVVREDRVREYPDTIALALLWNYPEKYQRIDGDVVPRYYRPSRHSKPAVPAVTK